MTTSRANSIRSELLGHFASFGTKSGIMKMSLHFSFMRLAWKWIVFGSDCVKRVLDIIGSLACILALSPILLTVGLMVRLDGGPMIFAQTRVGRHGRKFRMFKFRSMRVDAEKRLAEVLKENQHSTGVTFKIKNDPRITPIGHWLRRYSLDELPQLFNVLNGDMSLVGPRPPVPREVALYTLGDRRRLEVKPGITCIWQVSGRAEIDFPGQVKLDVSYIENQSLAQDLRILALTPKAVVFGSGAY
ncbi:MAG TPA: sugar transferase [Opitutaceae bacterium]|jgi:lipopolysaccharide/colanic/teichoic acid biosynthesis glycosyltransferase|nr:sugar transferase [Opitutaceae bacterium]